MRIRLRIFALVASLLLASSVAAVARQEVPPIAPPVAPVSPAAPIAPTAAPQKPAAPTEYMGRPIAPTMSYECGPWLMRINREKEERCSALLAALEVKSGQTLCDFGCGNGFYTFRLAELVGAKGKVYAVDLQPEMLDLLKVEAKRHANADVVAPILCTETDPKLPDGSIDLALLVDVYHELSWPAEVLTALKKALKPEGQLAIVEFRLEDPEVPIKLAHKMTKVQLVKELVANGYEVARTFDELPWQHVVFFRVKREAAAAPADGTTGGKTDGSGS